MEVRNLSVITFDGRELFKNVSFVVNDGDKVAVIGEEGNGKTTLLRAIYNKNELTKNFIVSGEVVTNNDKLGYFEQILSSKWDNFYPIDFILKETPESEPDYEIYNQFGEIVQLCGKLKLKEDVFDVEQPIVSLSGGEKVKLQLVKVLFKKPDILLLDEPTNDLDLETLDLLENIIKSFKKPVIYVSHDETLLENTANCIIHMEQIKRKTEPRVTFANSNYKDYVENRLRSIAKQDQVADFEHAERKEQLRITNEIKGRIQQANPGRTNSMRAVIARENRWEKTPVTERVDTEDSIALMFKENVSLPNQKVVIDLNLPMLTIGDKVLAKDVKLNVVGPEKIVIIGQNGCGKSSLIKTIYENFNTLKPSGIKVSYMPQNYFDFMNKEQNALEWLGYNQNKEEKELARTVLGRLKFTSNEMLMKMKNLSGGQLAKIYLAKIMMSGSNVLILDEPTRNLSPLSNPAVRKFFNSFNGAIISVSHDRKFINEVADKVYQLSNSGLEDVTDKVKKNDEPENE